MKRILVALLLACCPSILSHAFDFGKERVDEVRYINKDGVVASRQLKLVFPESATGPVPLVFNPHYEASENACRRYVSEGWAVAYPTGYPRINEELTDDDLVFNNAALHHLRSLSEIDRHHIIVSGGSAGGYMTLMLNALQLGICASRAESPLVNPYFNFGYLFREVVRINAEAGETPPFKVIDMIQGSFLPCLDNFPDEEDIARWEALAPIGLAKCFSSPVLVTHFTSDMLVPVDQITREFTYPEGGESMPEGFSTRLDPNYPGVLGHSLAEELPQGTCKAVRIVADEAGGSINLPYDASVMTSIVVFDDGPAEAWGNHRSGKQKCSSTDMPYLHQMLSLGYPSTVRLTAEKMQLLIERYMGRSVQLPAHVGVDDSVYGSLKVYREEILDELSDWVSGNSPKALEQVVSKTLSSVADASQRKELNKAWKEIRKALW